MMPETTNHQRLLSKLLLTLLFTFLLPVTVALASGSYSGGTGDPATPFQIADAADLIEMSQYPEDWSKNFILTGDINMNLAEPNTFTTALISPDEDNSIWGFQGTSFTGTFDGQNHTIHNLTIDTAGLGNLNLGLFGKIDLGSIIQNLGLENAYINGGTRSVDIGCLAGLNGYNNFPGGIIYNC